MSRHYLSKKPAMHSRFLPPVIWELSGKNKYMIAIMDNDGLCIEFRASLGCDEHDMDCIEYCHLQKLPTELVVVLQ